MKVSELNQYLRSLIDVREPSVDRIIIGDPEADITSIGTCWQPYWSTCREAAAAGINTLVVHEPTFYIHRDLDEKDWNFNGAPPEGVQAYTDQRQAKIDWLNEQNMSIIRCHDVLDSLPEIGIPFGMGKALGFSSEDLIRSRKFYNVYALPAMSAHEAAAFIAEQLKPLGQEGVAFYGDPEREVKSIGVGTGCGCDPLVFSDMNPDLYIAIDDTVRTWVQTTYAQDSGHPLVVINHGTSEEVGMQNLNEHLKEQFPEIPVKHIPQGCTYSWVSSE